MQSACLFSCSSVSGQFTWPASLTESKRVDAYFFSAPRPQALPTVRPPQGYRAAADGQEGAGTQQVLREEIYTGKQ